jgi:AMMECR1 domain-containing protein
LNLLDFSIWYFLQAKVQAMPYAILATLHPSIAMEWGWLVVEYIHKICRSFHHRQ